MRKLIGPVLEVRRMKEEMDKKTRELLTESRKFGISNILGQCSTCQKYKAIHNVLDGKKVCTDCYTT